MILFIQKHFELKLKYHKECFCSVLLKTFEKRSPCGVSPAAELLRQSHHHRVSEEDRDLLEAADRRQRGDHLRLQVPPGGEQNPLSVRDRELPRDAQLSPPAAAAKNKNPLQGKTRREI